jgi:hypothetical protein
MEDNAIVLVALACIVLYYGIKKYGRTDSKVCVMGMGAVGMAVLGMMMYEKKTNATGSLSSVTWGKESPYGSKESGTVYSNTGRTTTGGISLFGGSSDVNLLDNVYTD